MSDQYLFPKGNFLVSNLVTATPQTVFAAGARVKASHFVVSNDTAAVATVIFRAVDDSPEIVRVTVPIGDTVVLPGWDVDTEGLEVARVAGIDTGLYVAAFYLSL